MRHRTWLSAAILVAAACGLAWYVVHEPARSAPSLASSAIFPCRSGDRGTGRNKERSCVLDRLRDRPCLQHQCGKGQGGWSAQQKSHSPRDRTSRPAICWPRSIRGHFRRRWIKRKLSRQKTKRNSKNTKRDLQRFINLHDFATKQSVDTQTALVRQFEATIQGDQAAIESAQTINSTTVRSLAPLTGRTGVRLVDQGQHCPCQRLRMDW